MSRGAKVVGLPGVVISNGREPNAETVEAARFLLAQAESGEITGFVAVVNYWDLMSGFAGAGPVTMRMVGSLERQKLQMLKALDEAGE